MFAPETSTGYAKVSQVKSPLIEGSTDKYRCPLPSNTVEVVPHLDCAAEITGGVPKEVRVLVVPYVTVGVAPTVPVIGIKEITFAI
jgi:hypothetical protein